MILLRHSLASLLFLGASLALAHAELTGATPAQNSVVSTLPSEITLDFSEEVQVGFSLFKVYPLDETAASADTTSATTTETATQDEDSSGEEHSDDDHSDSADEHEDDHESTEANLTPEQLRLNGLAGAIVSQVLTARDDEVARADAGTATLETTSKTVTLNLKPDLEPGSYVVMWRALSVDTHTEQGYYVFTYQPSP